jgi:hypothetical protein
MGRHGDPGFRIVVCAVDTHAVHACFQQVAHEGIRGCGLAGHRDHDPDFMTPSLGTEQCLRVLIEKIEAFGETARGVPGVGGLAEVFEQTTAMTVS